MMSASMPGVILGTAAYMSPEQARGRTVDKRTDIWSFGCVLFEMLTGKPPYGGETISDTIAGILERPLPLETLPSATPAALRSLLRRCLKKDARDRLHDITDARIEIDEVLTAPAADVSSGEGNTSHRAAAFAFGSLVLIVAIAVVVLLTNLKPATETAPVQFPVLMSEAIPTQLAVSPDGRQLAIYSDAAEKIFIRSMDSQVVRPMAGTEGARYVFWSPDSRSIGFATGDGNLRKIPIDGGASVLLTQNPHFGGATEVGGTWNSGGVILFGAAGIQRVPASGGASAALDLQDEAGSNGIRSSPCFLPDGRHFLYFLRAGVKHEIRAASLDSSETKFVAEADSPAVYASPGYLLFMRGTELLAQRFDARSFALTGEAKPLAARAVPGFLTGNPSFSASNNGVLAFVTSRAGMDGELVWFDRQGKKLGSLEQPPGVQYLNPSLSPDEKRVAVNAMDPKTGNWDIWIIALDSKISTRIRTDPAQDSDAVWSPDGNEIAFVSNRGGGYGIYRKTLRGAAPEELLLSTKLEPRATDWTRNGFIIYEVNGDIMSLPVSGADRNPIPTAATPFAEYGAKTSPDGKWIAFASAETGENQIYIQPFPGPGERKRVSTVYGIHPRWRADGRELFYWQPPLGLMSVDLTFDPAGVHAGAPKAVLPPHVIILDLVDSRHHHAITGDGQRFLLSQQLGPLGAPINVILNWTQTLR